MEMVEFGIYRLRSDAVRVALMVWLGLSAATQAYAQVLALSPSAFSESKHPVINVAGGVRRGFLASPGNARVDLGSLAVSLPAVGQKKLCVELGSMDGIYHADVTYDVGSWSTGVYALKIPTAYASDLANYRAGELAVLAYTATQCPGTIELIAPAFWGTTKSSSELTVFLNSGSADAAVRLYDVTTGRTHDCERLSGNNVIAYDTSCPIIITSHGTRANFQIRRQVSSTNAAWTAQAHGHEGGRRQLDICQAKRDHRCPIVV